MSDPGLPRTLSDILAVIEAFFIRRNLQKTGASGLAKDVVRELATYFGGRPIYLPRGDRFNKALRNRAIYETHDGTNVTDLAREHRLSTKQVYEILANERERRKHARGRIPSGSGREGRE